MKILFVGDLFGKPGRKIFEENIKSIKEKYSIDFTIVNAENSASGKGLTRKIYNSLMSNGVDFITMGNHTWFREECYEILNNEPNIVRPLNLKPEFKHCEIGEGSKEIVFKGIKIRITNLLGNSVSFKGNQLNCFNEFRDLLLEIDKPDIHIVDFHAETTSEKNAFLWAFDGLVSAILGTHTHIPTSDALITHKNTAYISDVGMTGPSCGVIGGEKTSIVNNFFNPDQGFLLKVEPGPRQLCGVVIDIDEELKVPVKITQIIIKEGFKYLGNLERI